MSKASTAVDVPTSTELAITDEALLALIAQQDSEIGNDFIQTPILKIGQPLTREVQNDQAEAGEFINSLTGEGIGNKIGFVVAYYQEGRFASDRDSNRSYAAFGDTIPDHWGDLKLPSGATIEESGYVGQPFTEFPDAEEQYKRRVNSKEITWGKGPLVSTTHNFTGLAVVPSLEEGGEDDIQQVRLSLKRTDVPVAKKILQLRRALRNKQFWDVIFDFGTEKKQHDKGASYMLTAKIAGSSTPELQQQAVALATEVASGRVQDNQATADSGERVAEPESKGGLAV